MDKFTICAKLDFHNQRAEQEHRLARIAENRAARRTHLMLEKLHKMVVVDLLPPANPSRA